MAIVKLLRFSLFPLLLFVTCLGYSQKSPGFLQINIYHFHDPAQQQKIDQYLQNDYIPVLHQQKMQAGIFTAISNDSAADKKLFVTVYAPKVEELPSFKWSMYTQGSDAYLNSPYDSAAYDRMETILIQCFDLARSLSKPKLSGAQSQHVYELRSYESASEKLHENKVKMFNQGGEIDLFERLNFNAVFYGWVIAGAKKPNLMYMTSFNSMEEREKHWKAFSDDPYWKKLVAMPEYQHNVSKADIWLLHPASYSDY